MTKANDNIVVRGLRGKFGNQVVFRLLNGETIMANVPAKKKKKRKPTEKQQAVRERFQEAHKWAAWVLRDPETLAFYRNAARMGMTAHATAMTDYLRPPRVTEIDASCYNGHAGDPVVVTATDDFRLKEVRVRITRPDGRLIEEGPCQPDDSGKRWYFAASKENIPPAGTLITTTARDYPLNTATMTVTVP
ncbi:MAG: hypothetical protein NTW10_04715 [Bacteroidetes bacterium]|nr:hypothetical protein [Bacteroidota bacterium]